MGGRRVEDFWRGQKVSVHSVPGLQGIKQLVKKCVKFSGVTYRGLQKGAGSRFLCCVCFLFIGFKVVVRLGSKVPNHPKTKAPHLRLRDLLIYSLKFPLKFLKVVF